MPASESRREILYNDVQVFLEPLRENFQNTYSYETLPSLLTSADLFTLRGQI